MKPFHQARGSFVASRVLSVAVMAWLSGCGLSAGYSARCDLRDKTPQCTDWRNSLSPTWTTQQAVCATLNSGGTGGDFASGATCSPMGMLGGCQTATGDGGKQTNWFYLSEKYKTKDDAKAQCDSSMSFVEPQ